MLSKYQHTNLYKLNISGSSSNSFDLKTLIGNYICTDIPGEFIWKPGILSQCCQAGHWLLIRTDESLFNLFQSGVGNSHPILSLIDLLKEIMKEKFLLVGSRNEKISLHPQFRVFISVSISEKKNISFSALHTILNQTCHLFIEEFTKEEMKEILLGKFGENLNEALIEDLHSGGIDLTFPHHDNELAQSEVISSFIF